MELVAYAQLNGVIIPVEHVLYYLNNTSADDLTKELSEVIAPGQYVSGTSIYIIYFDFCFR